MAIEESQSAQDAESTEEQFSLLGFAVLLAKHKKIVVGLPLASVLITAVVVLLMPNMYTATTKVLPPQPSQSYASAIAGQLGVAGQLAQASLGLKNPSDIFVAILKSRTVADAIVQRFDLKEVHGLKYLVDARNELGRRSRITALRDGIVVVEVDDEDPKRAATLANAYIEELEKLSLNLAITEASQRRLFFEKRLMSEKQSLSQAESELKKYQEQSGLVAPQGQAQLTISASAALRAQITGKEVQLAATRAFATDNNPDSKRIQQEIAALRSELRKMDKDANQGKGDVYVSLGQAPEGALEYVQRVREAKYHETLYDILARQYEAARIDEAKDAGLVQVLDQAVPPEKKSKPKRTETTVLVGISAFIFALLCVGFVEYLNRLKTSSLANAQLGRLRAYLRWQKP
jgi:uncharacterized protein involved in exopolysaccharide biosynthesis